MSQALRAFAALLIVSMLSACAGKGDLNKPPPPLGQFKLGLNIVIAKDAQKSPVSRSATAEEWEAALKKAMQARFGRYHGDRFYDFGIKVDGYALAPPGIPIVLSPKSVLVITANIWDDPTQTELNAKGKQIVVFEGMSAATVIGSGLVQTKQEQMDRLAYNAAKKIQEWLLKHPEWFPAEGAGAPENPDGTPGTKPATPPAGTAADPASAKPAAAQAGAAGRSKATPKARAAN